MEFQAIVLAGGRGSRLNCLTNKIPKCLLPVGNMPMIWYPVRLLEKSGFNEIIILTFNSIQRRVEDELYNCGIKSKLTVVGFNDDYINDDNDFGPAQALTLIKDRIVTDCIILSCDLITTVNLKQMASVYRQNDASFLMLLYDIPEQNVELIVPGSAAKYSPECDFIGYDDETKRLLYFSSEGDLGDNGVEFKSRILKKFPSITFSAYIKDAHLYFIKKPLIDYIIDNNTKFYSLKGDVIPLLCHKQFSKHKSKKLNDTDNNNDDEEPSKDTRKHLLDYLKADYMKDLITNSSLSNKKIKDLLSCYVYLQTEGICLRTNNIAIYASANRQAMNTIIPLFARKERTESVSRAGGQIRNDSKISDTTKIGEKALIKVSNIGKNCVIGDKVKIVSSVIFDNVSIAENTTIEGSIVCSDSKILQKCDIKNSIIDYGMMLGQESGIGKITNEIISDERMESDDDN